MKALSRKEFRCSARYNFNDADNENTWCPERVTCLRYRTVTNGLDAAVGIESYQGINYFMAIKDCKSKIKWVEA